MRVHSPSGRPHRKFADNYFMMEVGLPGGDFAKAMAKQKAFMGRVWPARRTKVRVTVAAQDETDKFKAAYDKVMGIIAFSCNRIRL